MSGDNRTEFVNINVCADTLGVSVATIRNWIKGGVLHSTDGCVNAYELERVRSGITAGEISRLTKRANKSALMKTFVPDEYKHTSSPDTIFEIIDYIKSNNLLINKSVNYLLLNILQKNGLAESSGNKLLCKTRVVEKEIGSWQLDLSDEKYMGLARFDLPEHFDPAGFVYQSLLSGGDKSKGGSYYTPGEIVESIVRNFDFKNESLFVDPCCGTGQFVCTAASVSGRPDGVWGYDIDPVAVSIARINLIVRFRSIEFTPNILCKDTLVDPPEAGKFDFVATNPPWGAHFSKVQKKNLDNIYGDIKSGESFSYFIEMGLRLLKEGGKLSYILPYSVLNVGTHRDIRFDLVNKYSVKNIFCLGGIFRNVLSPVIRLDVVKKTPIKQQVNIQQGNENFDVPQESWLESKDCLMGLVSKRDADILRRVYGFEHTTLHGNAHWGLGIVTGDNDKYLSEAAGGGMEPVFTGKDIKPFFYSKPGKYIYFAPDKFQQTAPEWKYRAKEKLIYKFISKYPVVCYDDSSALTLNSANIVIPKFDYPIKVILALFNSSLYRFIYLKKFSSIKVLRGHLEELPLPLLSADKYREVSDMTDAVIRDKNLDKFYVLDDYVFSLFGFSGEDIDYIKLHSSIQHRD